MARKHSTIDEKPGTPPEIRTHGDDVTFALLVRNEDARLIIRCDANGDVFASIGPLHSGDE